jgi:hypothetical protein
MWTIKNGFPVSWGVTLALELLVIFITFSAFLLLALYIRKRYRRRRARLLFDASLEEDIESEILSDGDELEPGKSKDKLRMRPRRKRHLRLGRRVSRMGMEAGRRVTKVEGAKRDVRWESEVRAWEGNAESHFGTGGAGKGGELERNQESGHVRSWGYDMGELGIGGSGSGVLARVEVGKEKAIA